MNRMRGRRRRENGEKGQRNGEEKKCGKGVKVKREDVTKDNKEEEEMASS
jgi:hypothetical protein